jgi:predicted ferric reductase
VKYLKRLKGLLHFLNAIDFQMNLNKCLKEAQDLASTSFLIMISQILIKAIDQQITDKALKIIEKILKVVFSMSHF